MNGVVVLDSYVTMSGGHVVILTFIEVFVLFGGLLTFLACWDENHWHRAAAVFLSIMYIGAGISFYRMFPRYTELKVTLEDAVSWGEFTERYDVLSVSGKILTVREKEENDDRP